MTILAEGNSLKDGSNVVAKIAPAQSNASMCLEREVHVYDHFNMKSGQKLTPVLVSESFLVPPTVLILRYEYSTT